MQMCATVLDVICCIHLHSLLHVVESSQTFEPASPNISFVLWSPKHSAMMLDPFAQLFQHYWGHTRALHMVSLNFIHMCHNIVVQILSIYPYYGIMHCMSQHCWELLHPFAHHCQHYPSTSNIFRANNIGSCCVRLHVAWGGLLLEV